MVGTGFSCDHLGWQVAVMKQQSLEGLKGWKRDHNRYSEAFVMATVRGLGDNRRFI
jgi:hypothetical protein